MVVLAEAVLVLVLAPEGGPGALKWNEGDGQPLVRDHDLIFVCQSYKNVSVRKY